MRNPIKGTGDKIVMMDKADGISRIYLRKKVSLEKVNKVSLGRLTYLLRVFKGTRG
jgi:hypothetical protein